MQIELSTEQRLFVDQAIQQGRFTAPEQAMEEAISLWVERERVRLELLTEIAIGENSPRENDTALDSEKQIADFFAAVEQRGLSHLSPDKLTRV